MNRVEQHKSHGGRQEVWSHRAESLGCEMRFGVYLPPHAERGGVCPVLYFLSGLTCTEQNVLTKSGIQRYASDHGLVVVAPDTSPRGDEVADDEDSWDLGKGAGFYVNATQAPWAAHYRMYDYVVDELPALVEASFPVDDRRSVCGHSMGGHGALVVGLRNPDRYHSVSAFSPIVAPSRVPWGHKAFGAYLGDDRETWAAYDACELVRRGARVPGLLVDQGDADGFLDEQLQSHRLREVCDEVGQPLELRMQPGYDHSYYFIATFIGDHVAHHARALNR